MHAATAAQEAEQHMDSYWQAARCVLITEYRHTYLSARREWPRRTAIRKLTRELYKGFRDLPAHAREIRTYAGHPRRLDQQSRPVT